MENNESAGYIHRDLGTWASKCSFCVVVVALSGAGLWVYGLTFFDTLKFFLGVFVLFYIPGSIIVRLAGLQTVNNLTQPVLALGAGTVVIPVFYRFLRSMNYPDYYVAGLFALCIAAWLYLMIREPRFQKKQVQLKSMDLFGAFALLMFILVLLHFSHFTDILLGAGGFQFRAINMTESVFHLGLINSMADTYPPPALYASGGTDFSSYHLNMHLQADLLVRLFGLKSLHLVSFYMPLLYFLLLVLLPYVLVRESGGTVLTGIVCGVLVFGADFSFIPSIVLDTRPGFAWTAFFQSTIWSIFTLNGFLPSIVALFMCIVCLRDYFRRGSLAKLALFALLAYGAFGFKSTMGLQIGAVALATGLVIVFYGRQQKQGWMLVLFSAATLAVMFFDITVLRSGVGNSIFAFEPLNNFHKVLSNLRMSDLPVLWYPPMIVVVLLAGLGVRALGLLYLGNYINTEKPRDWSVVFIVVFLFSGFFVSEMLFIGTSTLINNSGWFYVQSLMASWFLLFLFLIKMQGRKHLYLASILASVLLAAPSTIQFLKLRSTDSFLKFGRDEIAVIEYLRETNPDSVILHPLNMDRPSLASNFAGRVTVLSIWVSFVTQVDGLSERASSVRLFFEKETDIAQRMEVLNKYQVDYIYGSASELFFMEHFPEAELKLQSGDLVLYRIDRHQQS